MSGTKLIITFSILLCAWLFYSCNKSDKPTVVKGSVSDYYSNNPVSSYRLMSMRKHYFSFGYSFVDSIKTDNNGLFQFSLVCEHGYSYYLASDYRNEYSMIEEKDIEPGKSNQFDFEVKKLNTLKLDIRNKTHIYSQIAVSGYFWNKRNFNDTIVYINNTIPEENYQLLIYLYKTKDAGTEDSIVNTNIWMEHKDTSYFKIEL